MNYEDAARQLRDLLASAQALDEAAAAAALQAAGPVHTEALLASLTAFNQAAACTPAAADAQAPTLTPAGAELQDIPESNATVRLDFPLSAEQLELLKPAHVPADGWDRWYREYDEATCELRYYRNATGYCFFCAHIEPAADGFVVGDVLVNRDDKQYSEGNLKICAAQLKVLLAIDLGLDDEPYWDEMDALED